MINSAELKHLRAVSCTAQHSATPTSPVVYLLPVCRSRGHREHRELFLSWAAFEKRERNIIKIITSCCAQFPSWQSCPAVLTHIDLRKCISDCAKKSQEGENGQQLNKGIKDKPGLLLKPELAMRVLQEKPPKILPGLTCLPPRPH